MNNDMVATRYSSLPMNGSEIPFTDSKLVFVWACVCFWLGSLHVGSLVVLK